MPLAEALERAGSFEALLPHLREGRILAQHCGLHTWPEGAAESGPGDIPPDWWPDARVDRATGRLIFKKPGLQVTIRGFGVPDMHRVVSPDREVFALDPHLERSAVDALWPAKPKLPRPASVRTPLARKKSKGKKTAVGAKESVVWVELVAYLKAKFPGKPYPQSNVSFNAAKNWLLDNKKALLAESTIRAGLKRHFPKWPRNSNRR
jgi:hypothetical protein